MSRKVVASAGDVRDVNNTCNVLHVARSAQFSSSDVLNQILAGQQLFAAPSQVTPADLNKVYGTHSGVTWLGEESSDVTACTWVKDIDGVVGTLSVNLKSTSRSSRYLETILPGDLLIVFMDDAGDYDPNNRFAGTLISVVIVDRVAETTFAQRGATVESVNVSARDLAMVFSGTSTVFDQAFAQIDNAVYTGEFISQMLADKRQVALSPLENVLILLLLLYDADKTGSKSAALQWKLIASSDSSSTTQLISLLDVTTYVQNPLPFYATAEPPGIVQACNVWALLESYSNPVLNEFFVDVRDVNPQEQQFRSLASDKAKEVFFAGNQADLDSQSSRIREVLDSSLFRSSSTMSDDGPSSSGLSNGSSVVALVLRQRPYDHDAFSALPFTEVDSTEVETSELARSSHDVLNWFRLRFPTLSPLFQELVSGIRALPQSIAKFGFRRMDAETRYMFASSSAAAAFSKDSTKNDFGDVFRKYVDLLSTWYCQNEFWYAGTLTTRLRPSIRVGTRLRLNRRGEVYDFYVQGVQHAFSKEPGNSRSTFTLTRGRNVNQATVPAVTAADFQHQGFVLNRTDTDVTGGSQ